MCVKRLARGDVLSVLQKKTSPPLVPGRGMGVWAKKYRALFARRGGGVPVCGVAPTPVGVCCLVIGCSFCALVQVVRLGHLL